MSCMVGELVASGIGTIEDIGLLMDVIGIEILGQELDWLPIEVDA